MNSPQVTVSPVCRFGRPGMRGITTEAIADAYSVGEDVQADYGLSRHELLVAVWFEGTYGAPRFRGLWREWVRRVGPILWNSLDLDPEMVELPPMR